MNDTTHQSIVRCSLLRRLAAVAYDGLLVFGLLLLATIIVMPLTDHGGGPHQLASMSPMAKGAYRMLLVFVSFAFFGWFWVHGGQTLGMKTWRIRVRSRRTGGPITPWQALLRYLMAIVSWGALGLGFLWALVDREKLTWHDRFSMSELEVLPPKNKKGSIDQT